MSDYQPVVPDEFGGYAAPTTQPEPEAAPDSSPAPSADPSKTDTANPFDDYADNTLQAAPKPTAAESFTENLSHGIGGLSRQASETIQTLKDRSAVRRANEQGVAGPGEAFSGKPAQSEVDAAIGRLAVQKANDDAWAGFESDGVGGKIAGASGALLGGLIDPSILLGVGPARIVGEAAGEAAAALGFGKIATEVAARAGEFGTFGAAQDAASQGLDIAAGRQQGFDAQRLVLSTALGMGLGATVGGITGLIAKLKGAAPEQATMALEGALKRPEAPLTTEADIVAPVEPQKPGAPSADVVSAPVEAPKEAPTTQTAPLSPSEAPLVAEERQAVQAPGDAQVAAPAAPEADSAAPFDRAASPALPDEELPLRARAPVGPSAEDRRFSNRVELPGEASKPTTLPADATDAEIRSFKVTEIMRDIANRLGVKFEQDSRIKPGALGTYKPQQGVLRVRYAGDIETFSHELGHAVDQKLENDPATSADWAVVKTGNASELLPLDFNAQSTGGTPSLKEGAAEFMRMFITNPAYASKQAPLTFDAFRAVLKKQPEIASILSDAARMSHIESGLSPTQAMESMISNPPRSWFGKVSDQMRRDGFVPTMQNYAADIYGRLIGKDIAVTRFTQALRDAGFQKTGKPLPLTFARDPDVLYRRLAGAEQSVMGAMKDGVRAYGDPYGPPVSPSLEGAMLKAMNGSISRLQNHDDPLVRAFDAYLTARRARGEWDRWEAGDLRNQPIRASKNETLQAIADFENRYPNFKNAADDWFSVMNKQFDRLVDAGIVPKTVSDAIRGRGGDYVPLWRDYSGEKAGGAGRPGAAGLESGPIKSFGGSTRDVLGPIRSSIESIAIGERMIAVNDVYKAIDDLADRAAEFAGPFWEKVPNREIKGQSVDIAEAIKSNVRAHGGSPAEADMAIRQLEGMIGSDMSASVFHAKETTARGERIVFFYKGGERQARKVGDNEIAKKFFDIMTGLSAPEKDVFLKTVGMVSSSLQSMITHAPRFLTGTLIRDNMTRIFTPRYMGWEGRIPMAQDIMGAYSMIFDREFYKAYARQGGIRGGIYSHSVRELRSGDPIEMMGAGRNFLVRTADEIRAANGRPLPIAKAIVTSPGKFLSDGIKLVESAESVSRTGVARMTYNYLLKQGLSKEEAFAGGISESRDVLNYSRSGSTTRGAARAFPFLNAGLQGADRAARGLMAEPIMAAVRAFQRDGFANLDAKDKAILSGAWKNWTTIGIAAGITAGPYYAYVKDQPAYTNASQYMKDNYWLFPYGKDKDGNDNVLTIHKPYDLPNVFINVAENFMEAMRHNDPKAWSRVFGSIREAVPRQFQSVGGLLEGMSPGIKTPYELATGMKLGFDGRSPSPLVPDKLKALPPEMQHTAMTSWIAKKLGSEFHLSPMIIDHVLNSFGGTSIQDIKDISTAVFDDNPLVSVKDAMNRFFFGQIARTQKGAPGVQADLQSLMARDHGSYTRQANAYRQELEDGNVDGAEQLYNSADNSAKTLMTLNASPKFKPEDRQLQPLLRSEAIAGVVFGMMRNLGDSQIVVQDRTHKRGAEKATIDLSPDQARQVHSQLNNLLGEETRNGLKIAGQPGYENFDVIDTSPRMSILKEISPEAATELSKRLNAAHILPAQGVADVWPETQQRLLQDRGNARLGDLVAKAKIGRAPAPQPVVPMPSPASPPPTPAVVKPTPAVAPQPSVPAALPPVQQVPPAPPRPSPPPPTPTLRKASLPDVQ